MKRMVEYTEPNPQTAPPFAEEIDYVDALPIGRFGAELRRSKALILLSIVICVALAVLLTLVMPRAYDARVMVAPVEHTNETNSAQQQLRTLASSVAGINLGNSRDNANYDNYQHMLTSASVAERLERDHQVMQTVYAREWDSVDRRWQPPQSITSQIKRVVLGSFGLPGWAPPSPARLADDLTRDLKIVNDPRSDIITISYSNKDPAFAAKFVQWVCEEADRIIKEREQSATQQQMAYIEDKLRSVTVDEHRRALAQLLLELERKAMMTAIDQPYAARIIDGPRVPDLPDSPKPFLALAVGLMSGLMLGCALALYRARWSRRQPAAAI